MTTLQGRVNSRRRHWINAARAWLFLEWFIYIRRGVAKQKVRDAMEMHQMRYFVEVANVLNFTRAAERCNVTQPALTRAIKKLEDELGGLLFRREGRHTHLTELGRVVLPRFEQALSLTTIAMNEATDFTKMVNAKLDLGCMCTICPGSMISLIQYFNHNAPQLKLMIHEGSGRGLTDRLIDGDLDVAILALPQIPEELHAAPLFDERYVVAFPKNHRFAAQEKVTVNDLNGENYVSRVNCEYLDMFRETGREFVAETEDRFQSENETWVRAMVIAGLGCSIMPESIAMVPELHYRPLVEPEIRRTIAVVTRRGRMHSPVVNFFVSLCKTMNWGRQGDGTPARK